MASRWTASNSERPTWLPFVALALALTVVLALAQPPAAAQVDTDGDGVVDAADRDDDNDGIIDAWEGVGDGNCRDTDGDGVCDYQDLDSDNDGISDLIEAGISWGVYDVDRDGVMDPGPFVDDDGDGIDDALEAAFGANRGADPTDTDGDGLDDFVDLDSDNDWLPDAIEALPTVGYRDAWRNDGNVRNDDSDDDGVWSAHDGRSGHGGSFVDPVRSDGDVYADYRDVDSDGDGIDDLTESGLDGSAVTDYRDPDGTIREPADDLADAYDFTAEVAYREAPPVDSDGDGIVDPEDAAPADPCADRSAAGWTAAATNDCDGDGITVAEGDGDDFVFDAPEPDPEPETAAPDAAPTPDETEDAPAEVDPAPETDEPNASSPTTVPEPEAEPPAAVPEPDEPAAAGEDDAGLEPVEEPLVVDPSSSDPDAGPDDEADAVVDPDPSADADSDVDAFSPEVVSAPGDQSVAGASTLRVVGELVFDADGDGRLDDEADVLDGTVVELWDAGADQQWRTDDDVLVSSGVHDGGFDLPADENGTFEVRVVVSSLPEGVALPELDSSRQLIGSARVEDGQVELRPYAYQPHAVCGSVTSDGSALADAEVIVTDALGNSVTTATDAAGDYCARGSLEAPLEAGTAVISASKVGVSVLAEVVIDESEVSAPSLALDGLALPEAPTSIAYSERSYLGDFAVVGLTVIAVAMLAWLVTRLFGQLPEPEETL